MKKIFFDTDVIVDFLTYRLPFAEDAAHLFELSKKGVLQIYISSLSISNIYYIISRLENSDKALQSIKKLSHLVEILAVDRFIILKALSSEFKDFEDALQNFCADAVGIKVLVTRNAKDYSKSSLSILSATELLKSLT